MPKRKNPKSIDSVMPQHGGPMPTPSRQPQPAHTETDARLVSTLALAGEALVASLSAGGPPLPSTSFARSEGNPRPLFFEEFEGLLQIAAQIERWLSEDPRHGELLTAVREALGNGIPLRLLFRYLFPSQCLLPKEEAGRPILSEREVDVLREAAKDLPHVEIAERLGIAPGTVHRHLAAIYDKLDVHRPMQAVGRAVALGYLDMDVVTFLRTASRCDPSDFGAQGPLGYSVRSVEEPDTTVFKPLAEFGLLLLMVSGTAGNYIIGKVRDWPKPNRVLLRELDAQGVPTRSFVIDSLAYIYSIAVAPPNAARHGFTPENLFLAHPAVRPQGLNTSAVSEVTPDGRLVRTFFGGRDIATRLANSPCLVFTPEGRLLITSNGETDAILVFSEGGSVVRRLINWCTRQIAVSASGHIVAARYSGIGCGIDVYDRQGRLLRRMGGTPAGVEYCGLAVDSRGHIFVNRFDAFGDKRTEIEEYSAEGELLNTFDVPGLDCGQLAVDAQDRLYLPCFRTHDIKVVSRDGRVVRRIALSGLAAPYSMAVQGDGSVWVSGVQE